MPYAPRPEHFAAANKRLQAIDHAVRGRLAELTRAISIDCYDAIRRASPKTFAGPIIPPRRGLMRIPLQPLHVPTSKSRLRWTTVFHARASQADGAGGSDGRALR